MAHRLMAVIAIAAICSGCGLSPAAVSALHEARETAERRAENFRAIAPKLAARDAADAGAVEAWKAEHARGLDALARALRDLSEAVKR
ncbi:MAG: hypothetical protein N3A38_14950 [Planctomycetota bacterium]|nr:hypothetical protein [Planctomycetota bacterium]